MKVIKALPPNFRQINNAFNVRGKPVIFCYGDRVYNPIGIAVGPDLRAHEAVHCERQLAVGVEKWWDQYIWEPQFRLLEELPAHQAEYRYWKQRADADRPVKGFRSALDFRLLQIAQRLASPLYGGLVSLADARQMIAA